MKSPGPDRFTIELCQIFKEITLVIPKLFQKIKREGTPPNVVS
jgi:hypothetical protein